MSRTPDNPAVQHLWQAINALYRGAPAEQQAAGKWLNEFADQPEAPDTVLHLLQPGHPQEVQFFSANMLLSAVKRRWPRLDPGLQDKIKQTLSQELERSRTGPAALSWMALQRLILAYAHIAAASGHEVLDTTIRRGVSLPTQGNVMVSLELLAAVAEAVSALHRRQRAEALPALPPHADHVFALVLHALNDPEGKDVQKTAALACLSAWLRLDSSENSDALMSPGAFQSSQKELFDTVLQHMAHPDEDTAAAATEVVVFLMGSWATSEDQEAEEKAVQTVAAALVALRRSEEQPAESLLHNMAQIAASLASRDMQAIAGRLLEAVALAALVLESLGSGHHGAAEAAIEYFDLLSAVPVAQRHPQLGQPVYASLLPRLTNLAMYPQPFTSWELCTEEDGDTFHSFREHVLSDALDTCQKLLRQHYLDHLGQAFRSAASWQAAEAALFALRLYKRGSQSLLYSASSQSEEDAFLLALFSHLTSPKEKMRHLHPCFTDSAVQLLAANSAWVASAPPALLEAAVGYILAALQQPLCAPSAASALRFLCSNAQQERAASLFAALLPAVAPVLESTGADMPSWAHKEEVVEGLASLIGIANLSAPDAASAAQQIALPFAQRAQQLASQPGAPQQEGLDETIAGNLSLVASAINRLEFLSCAGAGAAEQPAPRLVTAAMPHLEATAQQEVAHRHAAITAALCKVFKNCLQAMGSSGEPVLNRIFPVLGTIFQGDPQACLEVLTTAVDMSQEWPSSLDSLGGTISQLATAILPHLQGPDVNPDLAAAWFSLLAHCLIEDPTHKRAPLVRRVAEVIPHHLGLAASCLQRQEADLARALICFIRSALGLDVANSANTATACIQAHGELLVREVLRAVAVSCPQRLMRSLAILLHGLFNHPAFGPAARKWFTQCMSDDKVLGRVLAVEERQQICRFALNMGPTLAGSFGALIKDMSGIARNEVNADVLLSYEL